jgi:hypothetical protein
MAVKRMESVRENMMHQNFQSFGTPWWISGERSCPNVLDGLGDRPSELIEESIESLWRFPNKGQKRWHSQTWNGLLLIIPETSVVIVTAKTEER